MKDLFVSYELAKELEAAGFDLPCIGYFHNETPLVDHCFWDVDKPDLSGEVLRMPIYQQVLDWLEYRGIDIQYRRTDEGYIGAIDDSKDFMMHVLGDGTKLTKYKTKNELCEEGIRKALTILKEKNEITTRDSL